MDGARHYVIAEQLLRESLGYDEATATVELARALVHATLALAAATRPEVARPRPPMPPQRDAQ